MKYSVYMKNGSKTVDKLFEMECDSLKYDRKDYLESFLQDENVIGMLYQNNLTPEESDGIGFYDADDYIEKIPHIICERLKLNNIYVEASIDGKVLYKENLDLLCILKSIVEYCHSDENYDILVAKLICSEYEEIYDSLPKDGKWHYGLEDARGNDVDISDWPEPIIEDDEVKWIKSGEKLAPYMYFGNSSSNNQINIFDECEEDWNPLLSISCLYDVADDYIAFWGHECGMYFPDFYEFFGVDPFYNAKPEDEFYVEDICSLDKKPIYVLNMFFVKKYKEYHNLL